MAISTSPVTVGEAIICDINSCQSPALYVEPTAFEDDPFYWCHEHEAKDPSGGPMCHCGKPGQVREWITTMVGRLEAPICEWHWDHSKSYPIIVLPLLTVTSHARNWMAATEGKGDVSTDIHVRRSDDLRDAAADSDVSQVNGESKSVCVVPECKTERAYDELYCQRHIDMCERLDRDRLYPIKVEIGFTDKATPDLAKVGKALDAATIASLVNMSREGRPSHRGGCHCCVCLLAANPQHAEWTQAELGRRLAFYGACAGELRWLHMLTKDRGVTAADAEGL